MALFSKQSPQERLQATEKQFNTLIQALYSLGLSDQATRVSQIFENFKQGSHHLESNAEHLLDLLSDSQFTTTAEARDLIETARTGLSDLLEEQQLEQALDPAAQAEPSAQSTVDPTDAPKNA